MSWFSDLRARLRALRGTQLAGLAGDTFYVGIWQGTATVAELGQAALVAHLLGLTEFGRLALVIAVVTLVGGFFSFRSAIAGTTLAAGKLGHDNLAVGGFFQLSFVVELSGAVIALALLLVAGPIVGPDLIGDDAALLLFVFGLTLLGTAVQRPSLAVLRLLDRFRTIAFVTAGLELLRLAAVLVVLLITHSLVAVVFALAGARLLAGGVNTVLAAYVFRKDLNGARLGARGAIARIRGSERRRMLNTVFHTNLVAYARLAQVQLPTILIGAIAGQFETGVYKIGTAVASAAAKAVDPASAALLPRLSKLWSAGRIAELRQLIGQATRITVPIVIAITLALILLRTPVLELVGGESAARTAGAVLVIATLGQALYAISFWRTTVLYAAHRAKTVSQVTIAGAAIQIAAVIPLVPELGAEGAALALLASRAFNMLFMTRAALGVLRRGQPSDVPLSPGTSRSTDRVRSAG